MHKGECKLAEPKCEQKKAHKDITVQKEKTKQDGGMPSGKGTPQSGQARRIVLSCAWQGSFLEREFVKRGWEVVVITERVDLTTEHGVNKAMHALMGTTRC